MDDYVDVPDQNKSLIARPSVGHETTEPTLAISTHILVRKPWAIRQRSGRRRTGDDRLLWNYFASATERDYRPGKCVDLNVFSGQSR